MSQLFSEFNLKTIAFKNRIFVSPMCQYLSETACRTDRGNRSGRCRRDGPGVAAGS
jgi:2,4-dienoyl-CoA reductase-like NADH-dependent reductase (Old Yellow Enzyme family)